MGIQRLALGAYPDSYSAMLDSMQLDLRHAEMFGPAFTIGDLACILELRTMFDTKQHRTIWFLKIMDSERILLASLCRSSTRIWPVASHINSRNYLIIPSSDSHVVIADTCDSCWYWHSMATDDPNAFSWNIPHPCPYDDSLIAVEGRSPQGEQGIRCFRLQSPSSPLLCTGTYTDFYHDFAGWTSSHSFRLSTDREVTISDGIPIEECPDSEFYDQYLLRSAIIAKMEAAAKRDAFPTQDSIDSYLGTKTVTLMHEVFLSEL